MREKAIIWKKEYTASRIPKATPSVPVVGGGANAAMTTTTSATLTSPVALNWKAAAASSGEYGWAGKTTRLQVSGDKLLDFTSDVGRCTICGEIVNRVDNYRFLRVHLLGFCLK